MSTRYFDPVTAYVLCRAISPPLGNSSLSDELIDAVAEGRACLRYGKPEVTVTQDDSGTLHIKASVPVSVESIRLDITVK